jgi:hypothetical protein
MRHPTEIDRHAEAGDRAATRARYITRGLLRSGRARNSQPLPEGEFFRLERRSAPGFYWIAKTGIEIRAGASFAQAEPLQPGFVAAMARAGGP